MKIGLKETTNVKYDSLGSEFKRKKRVVDKSLTAIISTHYNHTS